MFPLNSLLNKYKTETDRLKAIMECIQSDSYYSETDECSFKILAKHTLAVINLYGVHNFDNPVISSDGSKIYFKPDQRDKDREGILYSGIKYATHFVTHKKNGKRVFDGGKLKYYPFIMDALEHPDCTHIVQEEILKCYYIKRRSAKYHNVIVCAVNPEEQNYRRVITFMPHQRSNQVLKYKNPRSKDYRGKTERSK